MVSMAPLSQGQASHIMRLQQPFHVFQPEKEEEQKEARFIFWRQRRFAKRKNYMEDGLPGPDWKP